jgi:hypothetical protein
MQEACAYRRRDKARSREPIPNRCRLAISNMLFFVGLTSRIVCRHAMWKGLHGVEMVRNKSCSSRRFLRWATTDGVWGSQAVEPLASLALDMAVKMAQDLNITFLVDFGKRIVVKAAQHMLKAKLSKSPKIPITRSSDTACPDVNKELKRCEYQKQGKDGANNASHEASCSQLEELPSPVRSLDQAFAAVGESMIKLRQSMRLDQQYFLRGN